MKSIQVVSSKEGELTHGIKLQDAIDKLVLDGHSLEDISQLCGLGNELITLIYYTKQGVN